MFNIPSVAPWPGARPVESEYTILNAQEGVTGRYWSGNPFGPLIQGTAIPFEFV